MYNVGGKPGFDKATNAIRSSIINPSIFHRNYQTLADITNGADGTYYYYFSMDTFKRAGLQLILSGGSGTVTVTVEGSVQGDVAATSATYQDITNTVFGSASYTASAVLIDSNDLLSVFKYVRVKVVAATSGADDADWTVYLSQLY